VNRAMSSSLIRGCFDSREPYSQTSRSAVHFMANHCCSGQFVRTESMSPAIFPKLNIIAAAKICSTVDRCVGTGVLARCKPMQCTHCESDTLKPCLHLRYCSNGASLLG
jgi:hypothetical protein